MALKRSHTADKFIVDRTGPRRNSDVARTVRRTRDRLAQKAGSPAFDRELIKLHARAIINSALAIPLLVLAISAAGLYAGTDRQLVVWGLLTAACYAALYFLARRADTLDMAETNARGQQRQFLFGHFVTGLGWTYFVMLDCGRCGIAQVMTVEAVVLLIAIAATALIAASLRGALLVTFVLPVGLYAHRAATAGNSVDTMMAAVLIASLPFFAYIAQRRRQASVMLFSFRSEKDGLIAELETAKAMSDEARWRAEEANLAKSRFLASMSHELRTPLNAILGFSEVMANEVLGPIENSTYRDYARDVHGSGQHLLDLINEILDLSRIEAGRYQLNEEALSLAAVVAECCRMMELKAGQKNIEIIQQFEPALPKLYADERAIRQITFNLLSNAIKFTPSGGEIQVRAGWTAGGGQYIAIKDNGPGIPEDEIPVVLAAFGQGSVAIKSAEQGTGLGLPIVQGLVQLHGGAFDLKSKLREGTEVIVAFPPSRVMEELPAWPTTRAAGGEAG